MENVKDVEESGFSASRYWWKKLKASKTAMIGAILLVVVVVLALTADVIAPHDPSQAYLEDRFVPPVWSDGGTMTYPLGTDQIGRCVMSRLLHGTRISLIVGVLATLLGAAIGIFMGTVAAYFGGMVDTVTMRVADALIVIPNIVLYIVVMGIFGSSLMLLILVLGVFRWARFARVIRSEVLSVKEMEYVEAARAIGQDRIMIMLRHIIPNVMASAIVLGTLNVATTIIAESSLSFLGLGVPPPAVSWGRMLADGRDYLASAYWIATLPGIAITLVVLSVIFVGDWMRDVLDPRLKQ